MFRLPTRVHPLLLINHPRWNVQPNLPYFSIHRTPPIYTPHRWLEKEDLIKKEESRDQPLPTSHRWLQ